MKKQFVTVVVLVLLIFLAGCSIQAPPYDDTENQTQPRSNATQQTSGLPNTDGTSSFLAGNECTIPVSSMTSKSEQPPVSSQHSEKTQRPAPKREETKSLVSQSSKPPDSQPEQKPDPPAPSEPSASGSESPTFDISSSVQTAKDYGVNIGLSLDSTATVCWDDPLTANARIQYLERDLRDRLDWYKVSGFTAFWVWAEQTGDGEYLIYIGYA